jgi:hypothetical protein
MRGKTGFLALELPPPESIRAGIMIIIKLIKRLLNRIDKKWDRFAGDLIGVH